MFRMTKTKKKAKTEIHDEEGTKESGKTKAKSSAKLSG
jgi:hypothetical protein